MNLNKVFIIGRLTADPQMKSTATGQSVVNLSIATNRVWTDKAGSRHEDAEYHNVVVWGRQAEIANQFLTKGGLVYVEGRLQTRSWQDQQGQTRKITEIVCENMQMGPRSSGGERSNFSQPNNNFSAGESVKEELPEIDIEEDDVLRPEDLPF